MTEQSIKPQGQTDQTGAPIKGHPEGDANKLRQAAIPSPPAAIQPAEKTKPVIAQPAPPHVAQPVEKARTPVAPPVIQSPASSLINGRTTNVPEIAKVAPPVKTVVAPPGHSPTTIGVPSSVGLNTSAETQRAHTPHPIANPGTIIQQTGIQQNIRGHGGQMPFNPTYNGYGRRDYDRDWYLDRGLPFAIVGGTTLGLLSAPYYYGADNTLAPPLPGYDTSNYTIAPPLPSYDASNYTAPPQSPGYDASTAPYAPAPPTYSDASGLQQTSGVPLAGTVLINNRRYDGRSFFPIATSDDAANNPFPFTGGAQPLHGTSWSWNNQSGWNFGGTDGWVWGQSDWWNGQGNYSKPTGGVWVNSDGQWVSLNVRLPQDNGYPAPNGDPNYRGLAWPGQNGARQDIDPNYQDPRQQYPGRRMPYPGQIQDPNIVYQDPNNAYRDPNYAYRDPNYAYRDPNYAYRDRNYAYQDPNYLYPNPNLAYQDPYYWQNQDPNYYPMYMPYPRRPGGYMQNNGNYNRLNQTPNYSVSPQTVNPNTSAYSQLRTPNSLTTAEQQSLAQGRVQQQQDQAALLQAQQRQLALQKQQALAAQTADQQRQATAAKLQNPQAPYAPATPQSTAAAQQAEAQRQAALRQQQADTQRQAALKQQQAADAQRQAQADAQRQAQAAQAAAAANAQRQAAAANAQKQAEAAAAANAQRQAAAAQAAAAANAQRQAQAAAAAQAQAAARQHVAAAPPPAQQPPHHG